MSRARQGADKSSEQEHAEGLSWARWLATLRDLDGLGQYRRTEEAPWPSTGSQDT